MKYLVAGPPCGGKTTYVAEHAQPGDLIVDFDDIVEEIGGTRYLPTPPQVEEARRIWQHGLAHPHDGDTWAILTAPTRQDRGRIRSSFATTSIIVMASEAECMARAQHTRPKLWQSYIRTWFATYQPSRSTHEPIVWTGQSTEWGR